MHCTGPLHAAARWCTYGHWNCPSRWTAADNQSVTGCTAEKRRGDGSVSKGLWTSGWCCSLLCVLVRPVRGCGAGATRWQEGQDRTVRAHGHRGPEKAVTKIHARQHMRSFLTVHDLSFLSCLPAPASISPPCHVVHCGRPAHQYDNTRTAASGCRTQTIDSASH
jgi:hypothetical protein